jgi:PAS domain S-box-containing protein
LESDSLEKSSSGAPPVVLRAKLHYGPPLFGYTLAVALIIVSGALRLALIKQQPWAPFLYFYPAVAVTSFLGGAGPGMLSTFLGAVFAFFLFPEPPTPQSWLALAVLGPLFSTGFAHLRLLRDQHAAAAKELASFKFIGDHASDWILLLDSGGRIRYANLRACTELGWTNSELAGRPIDSFVPEPERPSLANLLEAARSGAARPIELTFQRRDQTLALIELGCTGVRTGEAHVIHAAARDISERKRMEHERKRIEERLREVRHWESLGLMAGGLAHDFNNLLTSIIGYASLARNSLPTDHEAKPMLDNIIEAGENSADLVRMLLATAGYRPRFNEQLQLDQLLEWILANRSLPANVTVTREVSATVCNGDRRSFETLLWSLILNAAESYGQAGGVVRVAIETALAPQTTKASFEEGDTGAAECLGIIVEDTGCGMTPEVLERAFDPFFTTKLPGRGLGLPAVRGIVRAYSGKLLVETAPARGTRVEAWLPV